MTFVFADPKNWKALHTLVAISGLEPRAGKPGIKVSQVAAKLDELYPARTHYHQQVTAQLKRLVKGGGLVRTVPDVYPFLYVVTVRAPAP
jgi:hypothetical protein